MTPTINQNLKDEYAAYRANPHMLEQSYELWLEGTVNYLRMDLANAQRAIHKPDEYHAALEQVDKLLEDGMVNEARQLILEALGGADEVTIVINGERKIVPADKTLTYEEIVLLTLGVVAVPLPTVIYKEGVGNTSGILSRGQSVRVRDGMKFSVAFTGNS